MVTTRLAGEWDSFVCERMAEWLRVGKGVTGKFSPTTKSHGLQKQLNQHQILKTQSYLTYEFHFVFLQLQNQVL